LWLDTHPALLFFSATGHFPFFDLSVIVGNKSAFSGTLWPEKGIWGVVALSTQINFAHK
jgi:hypothetical protein